MIEATLYDPETGRLGALVTVPDLAALEALLTDGQRCVSGWHDPALFHVELQTGDVVEREADPDELRGEAWSKIKRERAKDIARPLETDFGTFDVDQESLERLKLFVVAGLDVDFTTAANEQVTLSPDDMQTILREYAKRTAKLHAASQKKRQAIAETDDPAAIRRAAKLRKGVR